MTKKAMVIGQTKEYREGFDACFIGTSKDANPYEPGTAAELAWRHGWEAQEIEIVGDEDAHELPSEH